MSSFSFKDAVAAAKASGALSDPPESGDYTFRICGASYGTTKAGDPRFGVQFEVVSEGPDKGKKGWENVNFISGNEQNLAISFEFFRKFGVDDDFWQTDPSPEQVKERILQIGTFDATLKVVKKGDFTNYRFSKVKLHNTPPAVPSAVPAAPVSAPAPGVAPSF